MNVLTGHCVSSCHSVMVTYFSWIEVVPVGGGLGERERQRERETIIFWLLSLQKALLHKERLLEMEVSFQCLCGNLRDSALTLIQTVWRFEVVSSIVLRPPSFVI